MINKLKDMFWNGTLKLICLLVGTALLIFFFVGGPMLSWFGGGGINVAIFFSMFMLLLASFFLPDKNKKKHRKPTPMVKEGSDQYLDQKTDQFSSEEREALLQESWMAQVEKYNRTRRN